MKGRTGQLTVSGSVLSEPGKQSQIDWEPIGKTGIVVVTDTSMQRYTLLLSSLQIQVELIFLGGILVTCLLFLLWLNRILAAAGQTDSGDAVRRPR